MKHFYKDRLVAASEIIVSVSMKEYIVTGYSNGAGTEMLIHSCGDEHLAAGMAK